MVDEEYAENIQRLVHLDLKGAPPKVSYYEQLFPSLRLWGSTGLLVEYEDTFPYRENLVELASQDAYSVEDIRHLQHIAAYTGQLIIPLVQTFGHMEFVLKHKTFHHLRESGSYPNSICPSREESLQVIHEMLSQVIGMHPRIQWIHIGGDEVWQLGQCEWCLRRMAANGWTPESLFLQHVKNVCEYVRLTHPGIGVIVWDDMFRHMDVRIIIESGIPNLVEPMIWNYNARDVNIPPDIWDRFRLAFTHLWIASSFKGASGVSRTLPDAMHHIGNHESWLDVLRAAPPALRPMIRGWALTGWQRYDHFAVLCELLPAAIPSLVFCLQTVMHGKFDRSALTASSAFLGSSKLVDVTELTRSNVIAELRFPGSEVFAQIQNFVTLETGYEALIKSDGFRGWFSEFHAKYRFGNPLQLRPILASVASLLSCFRELKAGMEVSLSRIFTLRTTEEWFMQNVDSKISHLSDANGKLDEILKVQEVST